MMRLTVIVILFALAAGNGADAQNLKGYELEAEQTLQRRTCHSPAHLAQQ